MTVHAVDIKLAVLQRNEPVCIFEPEENLEDIQNAAELHLDKCLGVNSDDLGDVPEHLIAGCRLSSSYRRIDGSLTPI